MDILIALLLPLLITLAIVTVVGHGIWVLLARTFSGAKSRPTPLAPTVGRRACPRCAVPINSGTRSCHVCGWPREYGAATDERAALTALREQVGRLSRLGLLDAEAHDALSATLAKQAARLAAMRQASEETVAVPSAAGDEEARGDLGVDVPLVEIAPRGAAESSPPPAAAAASASERVRKYMESRMAAAAQPLPDTPPPPAARRREALGRLLASFMEEKNIRWGELVGGLLIVGCSIALVISFWSEIAGQPLLKFVLFGGVTAALFGVGLYTERRWKLRTTSRGVLVIATLLVPLNFLAIAAFTQHSPPRDVLTLSGEAASLAVFAWLVLLAGRILVPGAAALLAGGVMLPSLMQLVVRRFADAATPLAALYGLAVVPIAVYVITSMFVIRRSWANTSGALTEAQAHRVLIHVGLLSASAVMPLALLVYLAPPFQETLHWLSPLGVLCGLPALLVGLLFWRRMNDAQPAGLQTAGVSVGVIGSFVMIGSVALAWPDPATLLPCALLVAVLLGATAFGFAIPAAIVPASLALAAAWLVTFHLALGNVGWTLDHYEPMRQALVSATSGHALVPLAALFAGAALGLRRIVRRDDGLMTALVAAITAAASLALVVWFGFARPGDPEHATWALAFYALATIAVATRLDRPVVAWSATVLLLAAFVQAIVYRYGPSWQIAQPWVVALLAHATIAMFGAGVFAWRKQLSVPSMREVLHWSALGTSLAAAAVIAGTLPAATAAATAIYLTWLAAVWLGLAALSSSHELFTASQAAVVLAIFAAVTAAVEVRPWYADVPRPWLDPWFWQAQGIALAAYCLVLGAARRLLVPLSERRVTSASDAQTSEGLAAAVRLLHPPWPAVDRLVEIAIVALVVVTAVVAVAPGVAQELAPLEAARGDGAAVRTATPIEQFQVAAIPHAHASGWSAWSLLAAVFAVVAAGMRPRSSAWHRLLTWGGLAETADSKTRSDAVTWRSLALLLVVAMACPLLAAQWENNTATASALRWITAGFFAVVSIPIWLRGGMAPLRDLLVALVAVTYAALGAYVAMAVLRVAGTSPAVDWLLPYVITCALIAGIAAMVVPRTSSAKPHNAGAWLVASSPGVPLREVLLLVATAPLAILLLFAVAQALAQHPIVGPEPGSWFRQIGWGFSYGVPLAAIALVLVGYAIRDRSPRFAFAAGLLANVVATIVVLLWLAGAGALDTTAWIPVAQVNAIVAGAVALAWLAALSWHRRHVAEFLHAAESPRDSEPRLGETRPLEQAIVWPALLPTQVAFAAVLCAMFLLPAVVRLVLEPLPATWTTAASDALGWWAVGLAAVAAIWLNWHRGVSQNGVAMFAAALVMITALTATRWDTGDWWAYHVLVAGCCAAAWLVPVATPAVNRVLRHAYDANATMVWSAPAVRLFAVLAVLLALRELMRLPAGPWWVVAVLAAISARNVWIAWYEFRRGFVWIAAVLFNLAASIWWLERGSSLTATAGVGVVFEFLWINVLAAAAMAVASVCVARREEAGSLSRLGAPLDRQSFQSQKTPDPLRPLPGAAFHRFAAWAIVVTLMATTAIGLLADLSGRPVAVSMPLAWAAWLAAMATASACWWDAGVRWPVACSYCVGLLAVGLYLDGLDFRAPMFHWALANSLAAYSLATSYLWSRRKAIRTTLAHWHVPAATWGSFSETATPDFASTGSESRRDSATWEDSGHGWLVSANTLLGVGVVLLVVLVELTMENFAHRMTAAYAIGAQALAIAFLARGTVRTPLQYTALVFGVLFAVAFGWAWLPPDFPAPWLHRVIVTVVALAAMLVLYGFGLVKLLKRENEWTRAAAHLVPALAAAAGVLFLVVLGMEVAMYFERGEVPIAAPALVAVAIALVGLAAAALVAALVPGRDPLGLSERGRTAYVYAAEALAGLLFVHLRVTMPWLFAGWFMQFWPLVVMVIAFVGVGLGELFHRRRQGVLSEPLQNTGALLPLFPALGFWFVTSNVDYSLLLLSVGVLYAALAVLRQSFLFGILAAVSANGSLWYLLFRREGLGLLEHPQLWLIPPALSALVAGHINRHRLTRDQMATLRYLSAIVIYVSSTADIFINGVANAPWLPAVLAGLSILGVLAGIMLRVRAFLYLGTSFLAVALLTVIWHAAFEQQRTWIIWVAGIITGAAILAILGLFEKRRDDVLRVVEQLKHWQA